MDGDERELGEIRKRRLAAAGKAAGAPAVTVYSSPSCPYCTMAKDYLASSGVAFTEHDVSADRAKAMEMVRMTGQGGIPVIVIDGRAIVGFDRRSIDQALGRS